jgi:hypothetical protein
LPIVAAAIVFLPEPTEIEPQGLIKVEDGKLIVVLRDRRQGQGAEANG